MSASRGGATAAGLQAIPAGSRKMVQSLKEIVGCSEAEIYAALKECNMDPNEAVNRLLSQDPFHEVKSKREKKKEGKDFTESRPRGANNNSSRGNKGGADRHGGRGSSSYISSDSAPLHGKASYKKENGSLPHSGSSLGNVRSRGSTGFSNGPSAETISSLLDPVDNRPSGGIQTTSGYQSAWMGAPGQLSMADIVKMGRPHNKENAFNHNVQVSSIGVSDRNVRLPEDHVARAPDSGISSVHNVPTSEEWPTVENPTEKSIAVSEYAMHNEQNVETSGVRSDSFSDDSEEEEGQDTEDEKFENFGTNDLGSDSISGWKVPMDNSGGVSLFENDLHKNMGSYQHQAPEYQSGVAVEELDASVSLVTRNLQQLSVEEEYSELPSSESLPSVVIPDHLQVQNVDCSYLSFGSFIPGMSTAYSSATETSIPVKPDLEEPHSEADTSPVGHPETRGPEYVIDGSQRNVSDAGLFRRASGNDTNASAAEELQPENAKVPHGNEYHFPSSNPGYTFDDAQHLNAALSQTNSQLQNLNPFSNVMQSFTNSIPSTLLPTNLPPSGESDLQYSPFPVAQSPSAKYGNSVSSVGASAISMSEALMAAGSSSLPAPHTLAATNVATGPPLPQHLSVHPYSQHTLPLGPFANMISYPFLPQSYAYMPSAFQQTFAGNSAYHQALAALLPQYKSNVPSSSLSQSAAIPSGYGAAFGNTTTIPGNFPMNPPNAPPPGSTLNYDNVLSTQNKDNSHLLSLQQSENPAMWLQGPNSRTLSAIPASGYYNYPGQNQASSGMRQGQPPSQNYGSLGYPNLFHSQTTGISLDHHQQNPRDGLLGPAASHGQPKQSQMWQNSY